LTVANLITSFPPITLSGEGHLTGSHRSFVKPTGHNRWRENQPITLDEGNGTSTQNVITIEVSVIVLRKILTLLRLPLSYSLDYIVIYLP
jgi:hypothetical protein